MCISMVFVLVFFFFFQAEDGIRDVAVTGVQTCALPISGVAQREWGSPSAAVGKRMRRSAREPWIEVIGVVDDVRHDGLEQPAPDTAYLPLSESLAARAAPQTNYFFLRTPRAGTAALLADVSKAVSSV